MKRVVTAARTVAKQAAHVKPAAHHHKAATGHAHKHHRAAKHHAKPRKHQGGIARGWAPGAEVACCAAEALAASLRLSGLSVGAGDVLDLFWRAGGDPAAGVPILAVLEAATASGLAGHFPRFEEVMPDARHPHRSRRELPALHETRAGLIIGVDLPGPHTVLATPEGWWSWGSLWCPCEFPDAVIEEAWSVSWR